MAIPIGISHEEPSGVRHADSPMVAHPILKLRIVFEEKEELLGVLGLFVRNPLANAAARSHLRLLLIEKNKPKQNPSSRSGIGCSRNGPRVEVTERTNMVSVRILDARRMKPLQH